MICDNYPNEIVMLGGVGTSPSASLRRCPVTIPQSTRALDWSQVTAAIIARFWAKVNKDGPIPQHDPGLGPCWVWIAGTFKSGGYGAFRVMNRGNITVRAHRFSYELVNGQIPEGLHALHHCDNPRCVRPSHLFAGTNLQNTQDKVTKGRQRRGETAPLAKLTEVQVGEIRAIYASGQANQYELATRYGVSQGTVWDVVSRRGWKHVA
jgi:hypothetical protein